MSGILFIITIGEEIMREFILLFRQPGYADQNSASPQELQDLQKKWDNWVGGIAAQGNLIAGGNRLAQDGSVLKSGGVITDGPFVEIREILGGYLIVRANSLEDATTLAHGCPALDVNGSVEVRPVNQ
ncbi:MAG: YciI family protein [Bacteroidia bacterium]